MPLPEKRDGQLWPMKKAASLVGVGLPRLYEKGIKRGIFTINPLDGRKMPTSRAIAEGYFKTQDSRFWNERIGEYRDYVKVFCTYHGLTLLQEFADELAAEKESKTD